MLITDQVATAPCTDPIQVRFLLSRLALFQQQIVSLDDNFVAGSESIDDFHAVVVCDSSLYLALLVTIAVGNENKCFPLVIENCGLGN